MDDVVSSNMSQQKHVLPRVPNSIVCPFCSSASIENFELLAMSIDLLDRAVESKRKSAAELLKSKSSSFDDQSHNTNPAAAVQRSIYENSLNEIQTESTYLLVNHTASTLSNGEGGGGGGNTNDCYRTGRWTDEEMEFVDCLIDAYDRGVLPVTVGVRLNDFLCSLLLCKASRLTKKMKNAKLSVRAYELNPHCSITSLDVKKLSNLQENFLNSIAEEHVRHELRFNMEKSWRTNLSNLCVQIGSTLCDATEWFSSLEIMDNRAALAYENIRRARRHQMGIALKTDVGASNGVFFSDVPVQRSSSTLASTNRKTTKKQRDKNKNEVDSGSVGENSHGEESNRSGGTQNHISNMLDIGESYDNNRDTIDDFAGIFNDLFNDSVPSNISSRGMQNKDCGSFLDEVLMYVEERDLPFTHIDVWVPSFVPQASGTRQGTTDNNLRLYHAGHCTRSDINPFTFSQLHEYGEYSTKFSFAPGVGLPGRVFQNGQPSWERHIDEADPRIFERAGGAKVYGIKTGVGIPIDVNSTVRRIIVALYGQSDIPTDNELLQQLTKDLQMFCPKPKWKLVVEMGLPTSDEKDTSDVTSVNHYHQGTSPNFGPENDADHLSTTFTIETNQQQINTFEQRNNHNTAILPEVVHYNHGAAFSNHINNTKQQQPMSPISNQTVLAPLSTVAGDVVHYHHGSNVPKESFSTDARVRSPSLTSFQSESVDSESKRDEEIRIAALLGDHMPGAEIPMAGEPSGSTMIAGGALLPLFMSLRLLLLRAPERRTDEENSLLDIIKRSYRGFSRDGNRSNKEIGNLLARDWQFLQSTLPSPPVTSLSQPMVPPEPTHAGAVRRGSKTSTNAPSSASLSHQRYQSFVLNAPPLNTQSAAGAPITMPTLRFGSNDALSSNNEMISFDNEGMAKKQRTE